MVNFSSERGFIYIVICIFLFFVVFLLRVFYGKIVDFGVWIIFLFYFRFCRVCNF